MACSMLIKTYGEYWNPDIIEWGGDGDGDGKLLGKIKKDRNWHNIDFWDARGIYVLHSEFKAIYVGKSEKTTIGMRLRDHLTDRLAGRWDMFSWYSVCKPRFTQGDVSSPGQAQFKPADVISTLEALAILIADPSLNRKRETLKGAYEAIQPDNVNKKTIRHYLEDILTKLNNQ